jgi:hypothetical protein
VATLRDWKGHDDLSMRGSWCAGQVPGWQLLIIGDGPRRAHLESRVDAMGLREDVRFTGNQDDCSFWFACARITTLPSYGDEGVPQSLMQAAACGLPAVSTPIGAIAEAVIDGETGLLVAPRDVSALAEALSRLMRRRRPAVAHGGARRTPMRRRTSASTRMLDGMEAVFAQACDRGPLMCGDRRHFGRPRDAAVRRRMRDALMRAVPTPSTTRRSTADAAGLPTTRRRQVGSRAHASCRSSIPRPWPTSRCKTTTDVVDLLQRAKSTDGSRMRAS